MRKELYPFLYTSLQKIFEITVLTLSILAGDNGIELFIKTTRKVLIKSSSIDDLNYTTITL